MLLQASAVRAATSWATSPTGLYNAAVSGNALVVTSQGDSIFAVNGDGGLKVRITSASGPSNTITVSAVSGGGASLATDGSGGAYLAWQDAAGAEVSYRPAGGSFGPPTLVIPGAAGGPRIAADPAGDAVLIAAVPNGVFSSNHAVQAAHKPAGGTWATPVKLSPQDFGESGSLDVAITSDGRSMYSWVEDDLGYLPTVYTATMSATGMPGTAKVLDGANSNPRPKLAFDSAGRAIIVAYRLGDVAYAVAPANGNFGSLVPLGQVVSSSDPDAFDIATGPAGRVLITVDNIQLSADPDLPQGVTATLGTLGAGLPAPSLIAAAGATRASAAFDSDGRALVFFSDRSGTTDGRDGLIQAATAEPGQSFGAPAPVVCPRPWGYAWAAAGGGQGRFAVVSESGAEPIITRELSVSIGTPAATTSPTCAPLHYGIFGDTLIPADSNGTLDATSMFNPGEFDVWVNWTVQTVTEPSTVVGSATAAPAVWAYHFKDRGRYRISAQAVHGLATHPWSDFRSTTVTVDTAPKVATTPSDGAQAAIGQPTHIALSATPMTGASITGSQLKLDGPQAGYRVDRQDATTMDVTFIKPGLYTATATATDDLGVTGSATTRILARDANAQPAETRKCLSLRLPKRITRKAAKRGIVIHASSSTPGCRAKITLRRPGHKTAATKTVSLAKVGHNYAIRLSFNHSALNWLKHVKSTTILRLNAAAGRQTIVGKIKLVR